LTKSPLTFFLISVQRNMLSQILIDH